MNFIDKSDIRTLFSRAMSTMYRSEVPKYGTLLEIVDEVNKSTLSNNPELKKLLSETDNLNRISEERHGAIRLGKPEELFTMRRLFAVMDMHPVGYYDLSVAFMPVHSAGFRPIDNDALKKNPFRIFTSLLRVDLITDPKVQAVVNRVMAARNIFSKNTMTLIELYEKQNGLTDSQAKEFVQEIIEIFRWHDKATVTLEDYNLLASAHPLAADIVSFKGPHINHLTPRTLDIDRVQTMMPEHNINPKAVIEGPPKRKTPILLRQTSFKALEEPVFFPIANGQYEPGKHRARFGEIEQRGIALTEAGRKLYDKLTEKVRHKIVPAVDGSNAKEYNNILQKIFSDFPDDLETLKKNNFIYLEYYPTEKGLSASPDILKKYNTDELISEGFIHFTPITYEDFLPVSAAGIFSSNLGEKESERIKCKNDQAGFEKALGRKTLNSFDLYTKQQQDSLKNTLARLKL